MNPIRHIPNLLTLGNLMSGCAGIVSAFLHPEISPVWFIAIGCTFDFFDGFAARLLKVSSPIGKELDSLADVVSFGVFPSVIVFQEMGRAEAGNWTYMGFLLAAFAALRLAKFNTDDRQTASFIGLPTPAMAIFISALPYAISDLALEQWKLQITGIGTLVMAVVMVAPLPLPALKFKGSSWQDNALRYLILGGSICLVIVAGISGLAASILFYLLTSFFAEKN